MTQSVVTAAGGILAGLAVSVPLLSWQRRQLVALRYQATHDPVTRLANRRGVAVALDRAARLGRPHGLVLLDLDGFKAVNDQYGHATGDQLLTAVACRLAALPEPVVLAGRLAGDEFVLVVHGNEAEVADAACAAYAVIADEPITVGDRSLWVTASVGYASAPSDAADPPGPPLVVRADFAMYQAKRRRIGVSGAVAVPDRRGTRRQYRDVS